jgi:DUF1680 family protein
MVLEGQALYRPAEDWQERLYAPVPSTALQGIRIRLIPYYCWNNRGVSDMTVWMPVTWAVAPNRSD